MTICIAAKLTLNGETYVSIASDSEVTMNDEDRLVGLVETSKIVKVGNAAIAICGTGPLLEAVHNLSQDENFVNFQVNNRHDARDLAGAAFDVFKQMIDASLFTMEEISEQGLGDLLIATPTSIYMVSTDLQAFEFKEFACIGHGSSIAQGYLEAKLENWEPEGWTCLNRLLYTAIRATAKYKLGCNDLVHIENLWALPTLEAKEDAKRIKPKAGSSSSAVPKKKTT